VQNPPNDLILARVARERGLDYLKGEVAIELRFAGAARTTNNFDLGLESDRSERMSRLEGALKLGFDEFTFCLKSEVHHMDLPTRCECRSPFYTEHAHGRRST